MLLRRAQGVKSLARWSGLGYGHKLMVPVVRYNSTEKDQPEYSPNLLDLRVGQIINVEKHENADKLYVSQIQIQNSDTPEPKVLQVCSGLVDYIPIDQMLNKKVVLVCNLKPSKMRGVKSEAMLLAASKRISDVEEQVEVVTPPESSLLGDLLEFTGFDNVDVGDKKRIKSKVWESIAKELKTDSNGNVIFHNDSHILTNKEGSSAFVKELCNCEVH